MGPGTDDDGGVPKPHLVVLSAVQHAAQRLRQGERSRGNTGLGNDQMVPCDDMGRDQAVLGQPAVEVVPEDVGRHAELLQIPKAVEAVPAGDRGRDDCRVADVVSVDSRADLGDGSGDLVPQHHAGPDSRGLLTAENPQIRSADGVRADFEENLTRARRRCRHLGDIQLLRCSDNSCEHVLPLISSRCMTVR